MSSIRKYLTIAALTIGAVTASGAHDSRSTLDLVYTMSNEADGNRLVSFERGAGGRLSPSASYATGGKGSGGGLGNQGGIASDGEFLITVNAGSNDVSVFKITARGLRLVDVMPSGGIRPVSVAIDRNLVYVLNAGSDNIAGFWMSDAGRLNALSGSEHALSGRGTGPAQISFSGDGRTLIVTEKATNRIVTFSLGRNGRPTDMHVTDSAAPTPFGFGVTKHHIVVSEAAGGATNASALSTYRVNRDGGLKVSDPAVGTTQTAACWVVISQDGRFAFTTNTGSGSISTYRVQPNGNLTLLSAVGGMTGTGSAPIDMALSEDGKYLHVLNSGTHTLATFKVDDGNLHALGTPVPVPAAASGLVAF